MTAHSPTPKQRAEELLNRNAMRLEGGFVRWNAALKVVTMAVAAIVMLETERDAGRADYADTVECLRNERKKADEIIAKLRADNAAMRKALRKLALYGTERAEYGGTFSVCRCGCKLCGSHWKPHEEESHRDGCPLAAETPDAT